MWKNYLYLEFLELRIQNSEVINKKESGNLGNVPKLFERKESVRKFEADY